MVIDLNNSIISLRSVGLRFPAEYLKGDRILFHLDGVSCVYDLTNGAVQRRDWEREILFTPQKSAYKMMYPESDRFDYLSDDERIAQYHKWMQGYYWGDELIVPTPAVLGIILSLASHQVKGDELIKGLKAMGLQMPADVKIMSLYTGGWKITRENGDDIEHCTVEEFVIDLMDE